MATVRRGEHTGVTPTAADKGGYYFRTELTSPK